jgi:hypothetical protein
MATYEQSTDVRASSDVLFAYLSMSTTSPSTWRR